MPILHCSQNAQVFVPFIYLALALPMLLMACLILGITNLTDVVEDVYRITDACDLPLLVDIDTGWGMHLILPEQSKP